MDQEKVVGRLAPSPTGSQHLGNAQTYLIAWLSARSRGGRVVLRVEDIDSPRVKSWAVAEAIEDLKWLGLDWDEGPDVGGSHGPYSQSERFGIYSESLSKLVNAGFAYPCTCTRRDVESASSAPHEAVAFREGNLSLEQAQFGEFTGVFSPVDFHEGPIYSEKCRAWQLGDPLPDEGSFCWRFRLIDEVVICIDRVFGLIAINPKRLLGDFPLTRKNGEIAYQLAVVVDDHAMNISEVVRGNDLLPSLFRQLSIIRALKLNSPEYAHLPLVVGNDGRRLAKRHGDSRLAYYRSCGVSASQIIGWLAKSIGLREVADPVMPSQLIDEFDWRLISRRPTVVASADLFDVT